ncbi:MAG: cytochrome c, partial [Gemmatimonadetes bacterium]|nr:cytochrome c [Gemmatimonadota bacterium]
RCHRSRAVDAYNASQWESIVASMALNARLTPDETQAVREFLVGAAQAREIAASRAALSAGRRAPLVLASRGPVGVGPAAWGCCDPEVGGEVFKAQCVACHGARGKGDGPAAVALTPRPANLADATRMEQLSDDSLVQVVTAGRKAMPGYGKILTPEQILEVVAYVRSLNR